MANKTFNIEVTMEERWVDYFCSMLKWMESCGKVGHSSIVSFYSDGDGDFRPKFNIDTEFKYKDCYYKPTPSSKNIEKFYDAG